MTDQQLDELKAMTPRAAIAKYLPMLRAGRIDLRQYEWCVSQAQGRESDPSRPAIDGVYELAAAFGGTVIE